MNVRIFWVCAMKCMYAQTRPRFILSSERVFGGMEFEPMLTPREKIPSTENVPRGSNPRRCGQRAQALPTELFRPPHYILIWVDCFIFGGRTFFFPTEIRGFAASSHAWTHTHTYQLTHTYTHTLSLSHAYTYTHTALRETNSKIGPTQKEPIFHRPSRPKNLLIPEKWKACCHRQVFAFIALLNTSWWYKHKYKHKFLIIIHSNTNIMVININTNTNF